MNRIKPIFFSCLVICFTLLTPIKSFAKNDGDTYTPKQQTYKEVMYEEYARVIKELKEEVSELKKQVEQINKRLQDRKKGAEAKQKLEEKKLDKSAQ